MFRKFSFLGPFFTVLEKGAGCVEKKKLIRVYYFPVVISMFTEHKAAVLRSFSKLDCKTQNNNKISL